MVKYTSQKIEELVESIPKQHSKRVHLKVADQYKVPKLKHYVRER